MNGMIEKMRADLAMLGGARLAAGEWEEGDVRSIGAAIKAAIDADDGESVGNWSRWLALLSAELLSEVGGKAVAADPAKQCADCSRLARPGHTDGCSGRDGLAKLYGAGHPLSVLPKDGGLSCIRFKRSVQ